MEGPRPRGERYSYQMHCTSVWNERCPVCGGVVPAGMPLLEVRARVSEYLRLRVCCRTCAQQVASRPTQCFTIAQRSLQAPGVAPAAGVAQIPGHARPAPRRWFSAWRTPPA